MVTEALSFISAKTSNPEALSGLAFSLGEISYLNGNYDEVTGQFEQALSHQNKLNILLEKIDSAIYDRKKDKDFEPAVSLRLTKRQNEILLLLLKDLTN